jgi:hypothetical protein
MKIERTKLNKYLLELAELYDKKPQIFKCLNCGKQFSFMPLDAWLDDEEYAFIYFHCNYCGYDTSLWKILFYAKRNLKL